MASDGIVVNKIVKELNNFIGYKIDKVCQPNKNTIILDLYGNKENISLLISIDSSFPRIHLNTHNYENPNVAPNFCMFLRKHLIGFKIKNITTMDLERIVFIILENDDNPSKPIVKKLVVELMGKHGNIILTDSNEIILDSLRHTSIENNSLRDIYPTSRFILPKSKKLNFLKLKDFNSFYISLESKIGDFVSSNVTCLDKNDNLDILNFRVDNLISSTFTGISSSFIQNIIKELNLTVFSKNSLELIYNKINEIINSNNLIFKFTDENKDYYLYTNNDEVSNKTILNNTLDDFYYKKETTKQFESKKFKLQNIVLDTLKKYQCRLSNIKRKLKECDNKDKYKLYGELITANLYRITNKNMDLLEAQNYYDNNNLIKIPLNKKYSPSYNAKLYFKKYNKLKNSIEILQIQKDETISSLYYIESVIYELEVSKFINDLNFIEEEILDNSLFNVKSKFSKNNSKNKKNRNQGKNKKSISFNHLKYEIDGYLIYVGRNNIENDYLTCKFANKSDIWLHTKDIHGSHVIIKINPGDKIDDKIIYEAAKLAALHSKAKNSSHVPVDYCEVKFVKKPAGSKPGYVIYKNNKTIYVN